LRKECKQLDFSPKQYFSVLFFKVSAWLFNHAVCKIGLKVPKREIFDCSDFPDFYTIKSSWVGDLLVKILTDYFNF
jgi:hypothetical protein